MKQRHWVLVSGPLLVLVVILGYSLFVKTYPTAKDQEQMVSDAACEYENINPLRCEPGQTTRNKDIIILKNDLSEYIETQKKAGKITSASIYFRDLRNGPIITINAQEAFAPASLLKVPLMVSFYKKAEDDPTLLRQPIRLVGDIDSLKQNITPIETLQKGKEYTIGEIIEIMIKNSDNPSWEVLLEYLRKEYSEEDFIVTLSDLGIIDPRKKHVEQYIGAQTYASMFRILYNASYLGREYSDKALQVLSESTYNDGIVAGLPKNIKVAHKFGEVKNGSEQQLHDCGIVYYPENPYLLCIMTKGYTISELSSVIQSISRDVYGGMRVER